ncbi:MAG: LapA family protein [Gemmatimonadota bacterium]
MRSVKLVVLLVSVVALAVTALQNQASWEVRFLWLTGEVPAILLLFLTAAAGFAMGISVALLMKRGKKHSPEKGTT